tara:strand:+ start:12308 stop:13051 length:744 start_codon:yes stop_codon:yes gene_type:complete
MNTGDFISVNNLLADILTFVNDDTMRNHGFNRGYYVSGIQKALEALALETYFDVRTEDKTFPKEKLATEIPKGAFNIREIYIYNGELCKPKSFAIVQWKRLYNNKGKGDKGTAKRLDTRSSRDPFFPLDSTASGVYYANIQNGTLMFSSNCKGFDYLRIVYNGMGGAIGDEPIIPRLFREAIVDYVVERCFRALKAKDRAYRPLWSDAYQILNDPKNGSWINAERKIKSLNTWQRDTMQEYLGAMNY